MEVRLGYSADTLVLKTKPKKRKKEKGKTPTRLSSCRDKG